MTTKLIAALVAARKEMGAAKKGTSNPFFKSKYADLSSVIEAIKEPLEAHGLTFVQDIDDHGVTTVILHESGEVMRLAKFPIVATKQDAQGFGSALTYARRYSLQTALGVPAEDDDGNAAVKSGPVISPVKEALKGTNVDDEKAAKIASTLVDLHTEFTSESGADSDADYRAYELLEPMDSDMKLSVWQQLQPHSKVRAWLKKIGDERKAAK
jgi:hypothetical protein